MRMRKFGVDHNTFFHPSLIWGSHTLLAASADQLHQAIDFSVGPSADATTPSMSGQAPVSPLGPPQYLTAVSLAPHTVMYTSPP